MARAETVQNVLEILKQKHQIKGFHSQKQQQTLKSFVAEILDVQDNPGRWIKEGLFEAVMHELEHMECAEVKDWMNSTTKYKKRSHAVMKDDAIVVGSIEKEVQRMEILARKIDLTLFKRAMDAQNDEVRCALHRAWGRYDGDFLAVVGPPDHATAEEDIIPVAKRAAVALRAMQLAGLGKEVQEVPIVPNICTVQELMTRTRLYVQKSKKQKQ